MEVGQESHYAMQIALKTLRERCFHLQQRICSLEEENRTLKLKLKQDNLISAGEETNSSDLMKEQLSMLNKEKEELSRHLVLISNENKSLWRRLSKLTQRNHNLGDNLNKISETLSKHDQMAGIMDNSSDITNSLQRSLEQVSSKLINGILLEKTELEQQYAEMVDLQNNKKLVNIQDLQYCFPRDEGSILTDINQHYEKLKQFKTLLTQDRAKLNEFYQQLKEFTRTKTTNDEGQTEPNIHYTQSSTIELAEEVNELVQRHPEQVCPMCSEIFLVTAEEFFDHVAAHFEDEGAGFEMISPHS